MTAALTQLTNTGIEGTYTLPPPYAGSLPLGQSILLADAPVTVITNLNLYTGITNGMPFGVAVSAAPVGSTANPYSTLAAWGVSAGMTLDTVQTVTGAKTFSNATLKVKSAAGAHVATLDNAGTADRVISLPDAACTLAQSGAATGADGTEATSSTTPGAGGATAPLVGNTAALSLLFGSGFTGSTTGNVTTITAGGAIFADHALAGAIISDGSVTALVLDNTATTATTGTITTSSPLAGTITATGNAAFQVVASHTHTGAAHTHTGPSHTHVQT